MGVDHHEPDGEERERAHDAEQGDEREPPASHAVDEPDADERAHEIDGGDERREPDRLGRVVEAGHLDDGRAVVHDRVDAGDLLEHLQQAAEEQGPSHGRRLQDLHEDVVRLSALLPVLRTVKHRT